MADRIQPRIRQIIEKLSDELYEREETVAVTLLAALSGQSSFLYGLPGTAKSLIARRISQAFKGAKHFEYLMQRFSTPEEVFGPVSIHELKNDKYVRKTEGYLPCADIAFLDEIWKSSPAILNTLLTIINERVFRNGPSETKVPLKALIAASNETPPANQGLEALYDRFVVRLLVSPMLERANFERLIQDKPIQSEAQLPDDLPFTHDEWFDHLAAIPLVSMPAEVLDVIHAIKCQLAEFNSKNPEKSVYVSDRRWQKIAILIKAAAYFCDRDQVLVADLLLLRHCLWTLEANREPVAALVANCIKQFGHPDREDLDKWVEKHSDLEREINATFFYTEDIYVTEKVATQDCFPFILSVKSGRHGFQEINIKLYAPRERCETAGKFMPLKEDGTKDPRFRCHFDGSVLTIDIDTDVMRYGIESGYTSNEYTEYAKHTLSLQFKKGTQRDVTKSVRLTYVRECGDSLKEIERLITSSEQHYRNQQQQNDTPFVPFAKREIVLSSLQSHIEELKNHQLNAEHLCEKVNIHANTK